MIAVGRASTRGQRRPISPSQTECEPHAGRNARPGIMIQGFSPIHPGQSTKKARADRPGAVGGGGDDAVKAAVGAVPCGCCAGGPLSVGRNATCSVPTACWIEV